jgi:acetolactate synthase-1/2/3 large subunit
VLIDITKNAQIEESYFEYNKKPLIRSYHPKPVINQKSVAEAAELINQAEKPLILAGHGIHIAHAAGNIQTVCRENRHSCQRSTIHGLSALPSDSPAE